MIQKYLFIVLLLSIFLLSCDSGELIQIDTGDDYIQLSEGSWLEYRLDSIIFDDFDNSKTLKEWDLRVEIGESFTENHRELVRMRRYLKPRDGHIDDYKYQNTFFASLNNGRFETFENNLHFVKFLLPPSEGKSWKGNEFVSISGNDNPNSSTQFYKDWIYEFQNVAQPLTINGFTFDHVAHINQVNRFGGPGDINHTIADEWYAKGIGLVKKRMEIVVENCGGDNCSEKQLPILERSKLRKGFILDMQIIDYHIADE